jgi:hypothetical protein
LIRIQTFLLLLFLYAGPAVAQQGAAYIEPYYSGEGFDYWYRTQFWPALVALLIQWGAPYFIAQKIDEYDIGFLYWKWWFIFLAGFGFLAVTEIGGGDAYYTIGLYSLIAVYGLFFSDGVTANKSENDADSHAEVQQGKTSIFDSVMSFLWKLWLIFWAVLFIGIFLLIYFDD